MDAWNTRTGKLLGSAPAGVDGRSGLRVVEGGRVLLLVGQDGAALLDSHTLRRQRRIPLRVPPSAVVDGGGRELAYGNANGTVSFVDLGTGRMRVGGGGHAAPVAAVGFSPDGRLLVSGGEDGSVILWDTRSALPVQWLDGQAGRVLGIGFGPDNRTLFTCGLDGAGDLDDCLLDRVDGRPTLRRPPRCR